MTRCAVVLVCCCLVVCGCSSDNGEPKAPAGGRSDEARLARLCKALESEDCPVPHRVIQEIVAMAPQDPEARQALEHYILASGGYASLLAEAALADMEGVDVAGIIAAFCGDARIQGAPDYRESYLEGLLRLFGLMGPKAREAIPFLLEELETNKDNPIMQGQIWAVLANVGYSSPENTQRLHETIAKRTEAGRGAVTMTGKIRPGAWLDERFVAELIAWLMTLDLNLSKNRSMSDNLVARDIALTLRSLGKRARPALGQLREALSQLQEGCDTLSAQSGLRTDAGPPGAIVIGLCVWQMNPENQALLRKTLEYCGSEEGGLGILLEIKSVAHWLHGEEARAIVKMLDDKDAAVVYGAMVVLHHIGLDASDAAPKILKILERGASQGIPIVSKIFGSKPPSERMREGAAYALAAVGSPRDIPKLQRLLKKEQSEDVREAIEEVINFLRLLE